MRGTTETLEETLRVLVRRLGRVSASCCEACCGADVSPVQSHILFEVRRKGRPSMQQVAGELGMDVTTFSRQARRLEEKGLISRRVSPEDRRVSLLGLTREGGRVLAQIDRHLADRVGQIFSRLTPFERQVVAQALARLDEAVAETGCRAPSGGDMVDICK